VKLCAHATRAFQSQHCIGNTPLAAPRLNHSLTPIHGAGEAAGIVFQDFGMAQPLGQDWNKTYSFRDKHSIQLRRY